MTGSERYGLSLLFCVIINLIIVYIAYNDVSMPSPNPFLAQASLNLEHWYLISPATAVA